MTSLITVLIGLTFGSAIAENISVRWMNDPNRTESVRTIIRGENVLIDVQDFADKLGLENHIADSGERIRLDLPVHRLIFTAGTPYVLVDGRLQQMPLSMISIEKGFYVPVSVFLPFLAGYYPGELLYNPNSNCIFTSPPRYDIFGVRYLVSAGETRVIVPTRRTLKCQTQLQPDGRVILTFQNATADTVSFLNSEGEGFVEFVGVRMTNKSVEVILTPDSGAVFDRLEEYTDPPLFAAVFTPESSSGLDTAGKERLEEQRNLWAFDVIVIDPGHGGKDPGAVGYSGLREKDVVLDIGLRLRDALKKKGFRIEMTRENDVFIPLSKRGQMANNFKGKLFISLHCNAAKDRRAHGMETYFLSPTKTDRAMIVAMRENEVIRYEESREQYKDLSDEGFILLAMTQSGFIQESQEIAGTFQDYIPAKTGMKNRGVDQAGFYVLVGASMPSVLVEIGFISNKAEENTLKNKKFRQKIADSICDAVLKFMENS